MHLTAIFYQFLKLVMLFLQMEFMVEMTCQNCVKGVRNSLSGVEGMHVALYICSVDYML